jgi:hypothetical protein
MTETQQFYVKICISVMSEHQLSLLFAAGENVTKHKYEFVSVNFFFFCICVTFC